MDVDEERFDEALYNRQTYAIGADAQMRLGRTDVLISGLSGTGMEVAKNIILTGVRSVTLFDPKPVEWRDLSSAFYYGNSDVGKNRVDASISRLQELNKYAAVRKFEGTELTADALAQWKAASLAQHASSQQVVVFVDQCTTHLTAQNQVCRQAGIKFIATESRGLAGCIFVDDGPEHIVFDTDGEEIKTLLVTHIGAIVNVNEDHRHELSDGDTVLFTDLPQFPELHNASQDVANPNLFQVKVSGPFSFTLLKDDKPYDTSGLKYERGGYVTRVRQPVKMPFKPLEQAIKEPEFLTTDFAKFDAPNTLHMLFLGLHDFEKAKGHLPAPHNADHAAEVVRLAKEHHKAFPDTAFDEALVEQLAKVSSGNVNPMASMLGGFAAHEVLKAASGKFTPINQWFYFDARECLVSPAPSPESCQPQGTRYDGLIAVFGKEFQQRLHDSKFFVVGAGALGCEFMKNFAMLGVGASEKGGVVVTDMDGIEKSNLSRQFLFRPADIGKLKSECAAAAARAMNPDLNVKHLTEKVAPSTEHIFDDVFWDSIDCVTNALDNVEARLYVDSRCVQFRKPLLESGTLGSKGNVQVVVPHLTESYGSSRDPPEKTVPFCTLKSFPNAIEHTIQWAREALEGLFTTVPRDVNCYINDPDFLTNLEKEPGSRLTTLLTVEAAVGKDQPKSFEDCVAWGRQKFDEMFTNEIRTLLHNLPLDQRTSTGELFWSGAKRPPTIVEFEASDELHASFVYHCAHLRAQVYGLEPNMDQAKAAQHAGALPPVQWEAKTVAIQTEENQKVNNTQPELSASPEEVQARLPPRSSLTKTLNEVSFEKDDDSNHHIDFITACSNLRARIYKIPEADRTRTKLIAGKIIPAMVTTTALVTGLVCFELLKVVQQGKTLEDFKNGFLNLAIPFLTLSEPAKAPEVTYGPADNLVKWTLWDRFDIDEGKDITLRQFIDLFEERHNLEVSMISAGSCIIYTFFQKQSEKSKRLKMKLSELVQSISKVELPLSTRYINIEVLADYDGESATVPSVRYRFRW
eukprot:TRINITY_DN25124_c0_g3_i1.p1 TRINITY_DN25124_c0_g3~~TRINITY_DN25124_c0_g3_i1.p1  ORF type:complete len:1055 (+),score=516.54 TRINITY_DN25124_c0_g3_i1:80-3166(+)